MKSVKEYKRGGRVDRILSRGKKKAKRISDREARREARGKDVEVLGTRRVNTGVGNPRFMNQPRGTEKVYAKARDAENKADVKAAKVEARQAERSTKTPKSKPPRTYQRGAGGKKKSRTGGPLSRALNKISQKMANKRTAGSKARKRSKGCGKECQRKIARGKAGFAKN